MNALRDLLPVRLFFPFWGCRMAAWSPDLHDCDFWLCSYMKSTIFVIKPNTIAEMKNSILNDVAAIDVSTIRRVMTKIEVLNNCRVVVGGHLSDIIFHK